MRVVTSSQVEKERKKQLKRSLTSSRSSTPKDAQKSAGELITGVGDGLQNSAGELITGVGDGMDVMQKAGVDVMQKVVPINADILSDGSYDLSTMDKISYHLENKMARGAWQKFYILLYIVIVIWIVFTVLWKVTSAGDAALRGESELSDDTTVTWSESFYAVLQLFTAAGIDKSIDIWTSTAHGIVFISCIFVGLAVFAVLVGFVNETVTQMILSINNGESKIATSGHTLILGWNEATPRAVHQIALLRHAYKEKNGTWMRWLFWWTRSPPSTPLATAVIAILCDNMTKEDMDSEIAHYLSENGIKKAETRVGVDIICRVGDPTNPIDLSRAGAHRAGCILSMMTEADAQFEEETEGAIKGGMTLETLLALRFMMVTSGKRRDWTNFRCVLHTYNQPDVFGTDFLEEGKFQNDKGENVVECVDLRTFVNSLMTACTHEPGRTDIFMELLAFNNAAFRSVPATDLGVVGMTLGDLYMRYHTAAVVGVINNNHRLGRKEIDPNQGIACAHTRVVTKDDRILLIAETTEPVRWKGKQADVQPLVCESADAGDKPAFDLLVVGWRVEWRDPKRFAKRVHEFTTGLPHDSVLFFLNMNSRDEFATLMKEANFKEKGQAWTSHGVTIKHKEGEAVHPETLYEIFQEHTFEAAVVLGTLHGYQLQPKARDCRVLATILMLRTIQKMVYPKGNALRVVAENSMDATSRLALNPGSSHSVPDFVNVQGIYARVLTQAVAYPLLYTAIAQLFYTTAGGPRLCLENAGQGLIPVGKATWAQVVVTVRNARPDDVVIGLLTSDFSLMLIPHLDFEHGFGPGDQIIFLTRRLSGTLARKATSVVDLPSSQSADLDASSVVI